MSSATSNYVTPPTSPPKQFNISLYDDEQRAGPHDITVPQCKETTNSNKKKNWKRKEVEADESSKGIKNNKKQNQGKRKVNSKTRKKEDNNEVL